MREHEAPLLFDASRLIWRRWEGRQPTGIDRVCLAYLNHYAPDAQAVIQHRGIRRILNRSASSALFALLAEPPRNFRRELGGLAVRYGLQAGGHGRGRLYLNVGHTGLDSSGFRSWLASANVRPVYLVHDLIPITHPQFCRSGELHRHRRRMRTALNTAEGIIGNSRATLDDLSDFAAGERLRIPPLLPALLGTQKLSASANSVVQQDSSTFVILGTIEARKNHLMLLQLWSRLIDREGAKAPKLLIIGQRGWECEQVFDLLDRDIKLKRRVTEIGRCSDGALATHLAGARALLFPSLAEGYGLPLAEALEAGVPVIASDLRAFREIAGDIPDYLDPCDIDSWGRAIEAYSEEPSSAREQQLRRVADYRSPSWTDHFTKVDAWLASL